MPNAPELLAPAGTLKAMRYAFAYGADAVYAGQPRYSLRVRENDFHNPEVMAEGIKEAHALGKRFYLASNIAAHNSKVATYLRDLEPVVAMGPDALIMSDPGLIMLVRERWPELPVHLSVQANAVNWATVKFWQQLGLERIILSRELSLEEVEEIRQRCPDVGLEVFVHGALCIVSPTPGAACCPATSTTATPTRAPAPTPAAGSTTCNPRSKPPRAISSL